MSRRSLLRVLLVCAIAALGLIAAPISSAAAATLSGQVTGQLAGGNAEPVVGATVTVTSPDGEELVATAATGGEGFYSLEMPTGVFDVHVAPKEGSAFQATTIHKVEVGESRNLNLVLAPRENVHLTGTLLNSAGEPVAGAAISAYSPSGAFGRATSGPDGSYSVAIPAGARYELVVAGEGGAAGLPAQWWFESSSFTLEADREIGLRLPPTATLTIEALGSGGAPLAGVPVNVPDLNGAADLGGIESPYVQTRGLEGVTDESGRVAFTVFEGGVTVNGYPGNINPAEGSGYGFTYFKLPPIEGDTTVVVEPPPDVHLTGTLLNSAGEPVAGAAISAYSPSGAFGRATSGPDGSYSVAIPAGARYELVVAGEGGAAGLPAQWWFESSSFTLEADREIGLRLPPTATLTIEALGSGGAPLAGVPVNVPDLNGAADLGGIESPYVQTRGLEGVTDESGRVAFTVFEGGVTVNGYPGNINPAEGSGYGFTYFKLPPIEGDTTVVVEPPPDVHLTGTLLNSAGEPVAGAAISAYSPSGAFGRATSGPDGSYSVAIPAGARYELVVAGEGGAAGLPAQWWFESSSFTLEADREIGLRLPPTATLTIEALGSGGAPLAGVPVNVPDLNGAADLGGIESPYVQTRGLEGVTDESGRVAFTVFEGGVTVNGYPGNINPAEGSGYGFTYFKLPPIEGDTTVVVSLAGSGGGAEPPHLKEFAIEPTEIETAEAEVPVRITADIAAEREFGGGYVTFRSPDGEVEIFSSEFVRTSGNEIEGTYEASVTFPQGSEPGRWHVGEVHLADLAGNKVSIGPEQLNEQGFASYVNVVGAESSRPAIASISPTAGPEAGGTEVVILGSGFSEATAVYFGGSKAEFAVKSSEEVIAWSPPGSGNVGVVVERSGEFSDEVNFHYEPAEEHEPPRLKELGFEPAEFDASGGEVGVHVIARVDDSTGFVNGNIVFRSPSGEGFVKAIGFERLAGSEDLYETVATFPEGSEPGDWLVSSIYFYDEAGGELSVEAEELVERGFPYEVTVLPPKVEAPVVTGISPSSGPESGGTKVVISGSGFKGAEAVRFGGSKAEFEIRSPEEIVAFSPPGKGNVGVVVENAGGISGEVNFAYVPSATVALASSPNPSARGQKVTFTATVSPSEGGATPVGTVAFVEGTSTLGVANLSKGVAKLNTTTLGAGEHPIVAEYSGDSHYGESQSSPLTQVVSKATTEVTLTSSLNPSPFGATGTLKAHVAAVAPGAGTPAGTVTFREGETVLDTVQLSGGNASLSLKALEPGTHAITASYSGDANDKASEGGPFSQTVTKAATELALTSTLNPAPFGSSATLKATVKAVAPGGGTPAGTVTFREGETVLAIVPLSAGSAKYALKTAAPGEHGITATYSGEADYEGSSDSLGQVITVAATELTLTSSKNPAPHGSTGTLKATVKAVAPGAGTPTGTVTFREGETVLAIVPLSGSAATYPLKSLAVGEHKITATYNGSADYEASEAVIVQVVTS